LIFRFSFYLVNTRCGTYANRLCYTESNGPTLTGIIFAIAIGLFIFLMVLKACITCCSSSNSYHSLSSSDPAYLARSGAVVCTVAASHCWSCHYEALIECYIQINISENSTEIFKHQFLLKSSLQFSIEKKNKTFLYATMLNSDNFSLLSTIQWRSQKCLQKFFLSIRSSSYLWTHIIIDNDNASIPAKRARFDIG